MTRTGVAIQSRSLCRVTAPRCGTQRSGHGFRRASEDLGRQRIRCRWIEAPRAAAVRGRVRVAWDQVHVTVMDLVTEGELVDVLSPQRCELGAHDLDRERTQRCRFFGREGVDAADMSFAGKYQPPGDGAGRRQCMQNEPCFAEQDAAGDLS